MGSEVSELVEKYVREGIKGVLFREWMSPLPRELTFEEGANFMELRHRTYLISELASQYESYARASIREAFDNSVARALSELSGIPFEVQDD